MQSIPTTALICVHNNIASDLCKGVSSISLMQYGGGGRGDYEQRSNYGSYNNNREGGGGGGGGGGYSGSRDSSGGGYRIPAHKMVYDGKRMRKAITRRTIDFNATVLRGLQARTPFERNSRGIIRTTIQPHPDFLVNLTCPSHRQDDFGSSVVTKFVHASMNKVKSPVQVVRWTPEGRRLLTGSSSGEFTFWNGTTFNFETILQAHDASIRSMTWSHNGNFLVSGDQIGTIKFWQPSLNNLKVIPNAHRESVKNITFSPSDSKFASCSDDGLIKIWDFAEAAEERTLSGHGWDVRTIHWHPYKSLLASGSKDNLVKLWDPKSGSTLATIHGHRNNITDLKWNKNGNWLASAGKDQVIKLFDIRMMKEFQSLKGHTKEINNIAWHPIHESLFTTGSGDGSIMFWSALCEKGLGSLVGAHDGLCLSLDWHPVGHVLASGSIDSSVRFWIRHRPSDSCLDQYVIGKQAAEEMGIRNAEPVISVAEDEDDGREEEFMIPGVNRQGGGGPYNTTRRSRY